MPAPVFGRASRAYKEGMERTGFYYVDNFDKYGHKMPSIAGLASILGLSSSILKVWADKKWYRFDEVFHRIKDRQEIVLINEAMKGNITGGVLKTLLFYRNAKALEGDRDEEGKSVKGVTIEIRDFKVETVEENTLPAPKTLYPGKKDQYKPFDYSVAYDPDDDEDEDGELDD